MYREFPISDIDSVLVELEECEYYYEHGREYKKILEAEGVEYYADQYLFTLPEIGYAFCDGYLTTDNEDWEDVVIVFRVTEEQAQEVADIYTNTSLCSIILMQAEERGEDMENTKCILSVCDEIG